MRKESEKCRKVVEGPAPRCELLKRRNKARIVGGCGESAMSLKISSPRPPAGPGGRPLTADQLKVCSDQSPEATKFPCCSEGSLRGAQNIGTRKKNVLTVLCVTKPLYFPMPTLCIGPRRGAFDEGIEGKPRTDPLRDADVIERF